MKTVLFQKLQVESDPSLHLLIKRGVDGFITAVYDSISFHKLSVVTAWVGCLLPRCWY